MEDNIIYREAPLMVSGSAADRSIEGYAAIYDIPYTPVLGKKSYEVIRKGAFAKSFARILDKSQRPIEILWAHQRWATLASTGNDSAVVEDRDLGPWFKARLGTTFIDDLAFQKISERVVNTVSFGMTVIKKEQGFIGNSPVDIIVEAELFEISPTVLASNTLTSVMITRAVETDGKTITEAPIEERTVDVVEQKNTNEEVKQKTTVVEAQAPTEEDMMEKAKHMRIIAAKKRYIALSKHKV